MHWETKIIVCFTFLQQSGSKPAVSEVRLYSISLATGPSLFLSVFQSNKVPVVQHPHHMHPLTPLITYSNDHFSPGSPPTHLSPEIDPKTGELTAAQAGPGDSEEKCLRSHTC